MEFEWDDMEATLDEACSLFKLWYANQYVSSALEARLNQAEFLIGSKLLKDLIPLIRPDNHLQLLVGNTALDAYKFNMSDNGILQARQSIVKPKGQLLISQVVNVWGQSPSPKADTYVGQNQFISMSSLAVSLCNGGELYMI